MFLEEAIFFLPVFVLLLVLLKATSSIQICLGKEGRLSQSKIQYHQKHRRP